MDIIDDSLLDYAKLLFLQYLHLNLDDSFLDSDYIFKVSYGVYSNLKKNVSDFLVLF